MKFLQHKQWERKCDVLFTSLCCLVFSFLAYFQSVVIMNECSMISSGTWPHLLDLVGQLHRVEHFTIESPPSHGAAWNKILFYFFKAK